MFEEITKKSFIEEITSGSSILVFGGSCPKDLVQEEMFDRVCEVAERAMMEHSDLDERVCTKHATYLEFRNTQGMKSYYYFNNKGTKSYYRYGNILVAKNHVVEEANEKCSFNIDTMNFCIYVVL